MDLSHLNKPQAEAVRTTEGPLLVLAGAGSGKTRVIAHRVAYLLAVKKVPARHILAVTFTNKAAAEMRERIAILAAEVGGKGVAKGLTVTTFHAFGAEVLRDEGVHVGLPRGFAIADSGDQLAIVKRALRELRIDEKKADARKVLGLISKAKCAGKEPGMGAAEATEEGAEEDVEEGPVDDDEMILEWVFPKYQASLRAQAMVDFDDLIIEPERLFRNNAEVRARYIDRYRYMLVDEYQDTSKTQYELLRHLSGLRRNLCVVGDDDQSIYSWRGAEVDNILKFDQVFPGAKEVYLEQNYRSVGNVLACANAVIQVNEERKDKKLWCDKGEGDKVRVVTCPDDESEASYVTREIEGLVKSGKAPRDIAVLYRTSAQSKGIEEGLRELNIPYEVTGGPEFFDRREVKDLVAYLKTCVNPDDELSVLRIINVPARGIGEVTIEKVNAHAGASKLTLWAALQSVDQIEGLGAGAKKSVSEFVSLIEGYRGKFAQSSIENVAKELVETIGLRDEVRRGTTTNEQAQKRIAALDMMLESIEKHAQKGKRDLSGYLTKLALDSGEKEEAGGNHVTLSTLHASKGLEWPVVFLIGCEEELLPHKGMQGEAQNLPEERRLCYVGITRAREKLTMSRCKTRSSRGKSLPRTPSRFLEDLPLDAIDLIDLEAPPKEANPAREQNFLSDLRARLRASIAPT
jgi:DNA helicase-2/ATP-dependent DNA helicase PcrA